MTNRFGFDNAEFATRQTRFANFFLSIILVGNAATGLSSFCVDVQTASLTEAQTGRRTLVDYYQIFHVHAAITTATTAMHASDHDTLDFIRKGCMVASFASFFLSLGSGMGLLLCVGLFFRVRCVYGSMLWYHRVRVKDANWAFTIGCSVTETRSTSRTSILTMERKHCGNWCSFF